jgi:nicotinate-nucleotide--dimethylbenzimidazole phosphoribosyltransferase
MAGALFEARLRSIPVLLDGYIATSPALVLHQVDPGLVANCRAGHLSAEQGHGRVLEHLGLTPLLTLDMRLGEASGAMAAVPLVKMACALVTDVPTFSEWFGPRA